MRRKGSAKLIPVDPKTLTSANEQHINSLLSMGYRPYQTEDGSIRWLTEGQYTYNQIKHKKKSIINSIFNKEYRGLRRRRRSQIKRFFHRNAELILLTVGVVAFIAILRYVTY